MSFQSFCRRGALILVGFLPLSVFSLTSETETDISRDFLFDSAKRYLLLRQTDSVAKKESFQLEDRSSGILRFSYRDGDFVDPGGIIELIELESGNVKVRVNLPSDQIGRSRLLMQKLIAYASDELHGKTGRELPYSALSVYRSAKRYVLKNCVRPGEGVPDVIQMDVEDVGLLKFVYREREIVDRAATLNVLSLGGQRSRLIVTLPSLDMARKLLLEDKLISAITEDLGSKEDEPSES